MGGGQARGAGAPPGGVAPRPAGAGGADDDVDDDERVDRSPQPQRRRAGDDVTGLQALGQEGGAGGRGGGGVGGQVAVGHGDQDALGHEGR
ncbi:hypothetical protein [Quadrisphaera sp. KR29]|uniref:hypothetical protein n=1 Tax=Quadrisphaera sp. KR29 TaxID=3461391 RepID=UPI0040449B74